MVTIMSSQKILGVQCTSCSTKTFPKRNFCPNCRSTQLKDWAVPLEGVIYSFTIVHFPIEKYDEAPYYVGLISFESDKKPLITAKLSFQNEENLKIGKSVHLSVIKNFGPYQRNIVIATIDE